MERSGNLITIGFLVVVKVLLTHYSSRASLIRLFEATIRYGPGRMLLTTFLLRWADLAIFEVRVGKCEVIV